ncbi:hypothetical protein HYPSUDRAFT_37019 [Hypholoma sublateritium FD-334 SS-4]|uniref:Glutamine amidotransferase type-2 domain-containing protein n=1 Tax=Hypholoma sublateritium (strain FD-334 SS-4) TaxID=945553 RepID=A0A0D2LF09_HYPSF|nr:hypothetical protein HYPSUDRAFT_37019 [Hypholoma sublateritium FD-334 SS-4]
MCGIYVSARFLPSQDDRFALLAHDLQRVNAARGPDVQKIETLHFPSSPAILSTSILPTCPSNNFHEILEIAFFASELRLRGDSPVVQPHTGGGNVLCYNGEIFEGLEIYSHENDGCKLFEALSAAKSLEDIQHILSNIEGPYAFVFYHADSHRMYYARDPLGRRSLLIHEPTGELPYLLLASVSTGANVAYNFTELSTEHLYSLDITTLKSLSNISAGFHQSLGKHSRFPVNSVYLNPFHELAKVSSALPSDDIPIVRSLGNIPEHMLCTVDDFILYLDKSVERQVSDIPRFSLSKGKARLAVLFSGGIDSSIITFLANKHVPLGEPIDLLNVAFENPRKLRHLKEGNIGGVPRHVRRGEAHRKPTQPAVEKEPYLVPDRATGLMELEEIRRVCPGRIWNFVEINVPYTECQEKRPIVESLMSPARTIMDLSLALALYFASRGHGQIRKTPESHPEPYISEARVLLNGLGSDELLGGYGRHRTVYSTGGWEAVIKELQEEIDRLPVRNLGRDDRVISSHGKETRHPFLSLTLVSFLASLPVHFKMDPRGELGTGDKMLLRLATYKLGLVEASCRKKRAMQFGSHSARMEGEKRGDIDLE